MTNDISDQGSDTALVRPRALRPGDTVAVIAPASQLKSGLEETLHRGLAWLESQGWKHRLMPHSAASHATLPHLAGEDEARLADLHAAFADSEIQAVWCIRGGYGTPRLMGSIDYDLIAANPKVFIGFSDITAIHVALNQRLGLVTFHGPMIASNLGTEKWQRSEWAIASLRRAITLTNEPPGPLSQGDQTMMGRSLVEGVAEGTTIGGNLSLICGMLGTPVGLDDSPGRILLIEDVGETPYRADRALTQLRLAHKLSAVAGIAVGQFTELTAEEQTSMEEVFRDRLGDLGIPVVTGLPFGHEDPAGCIPLGAPARLEARSDGTGDLIITEPAVV